MKKLLAIILSLSMLISLCACTVEDPIATPEEEITLGNVESEQNPDLNPTPDSDGEVIYEPETEDVLPDEDIISDDEVPAEDDSFDAFLESISNDDFTLTLSGGPSTYYLDEEIFAEAYISLIGHETLTVYSGDPILTYSLSGSTYFNDGQGGGMVATILAEYRFNNTEDAIYPLVKSGGWSQSDPNADFYEEFFRSEKYILPAGVYTLTCTLDYSTDPDDVLGTRKTLSLTYTFEVVDICKTPVEVATGDYEDEDITEETIDPADILEPVEPEVFEPTGNYFVYNISGPFIYLTDDDAEWLADKLSSWNWGQAETYGSINVNLHINGESYTYVTQSGVLTTVWQGEDAPWLTTTLSPDDKWALNDMIHTYVNASATDSTVWVESTLYESESYTETLVNKLPDDVADSLKSYLRSANWINEPSDCLYDVTVKIDGYELYYSTSCGSFANYDFDSYTHLADDDMRAVNELLEGYVATVVVETCIEPEE